jgi:hypothetical protein
MNAGGDVMTKQLSLTDAIRIRTVAPDAHAAAKTFAAATRKLRDALQAK